MNTDKIYAEHIVNKYSVKKTLKVEQLKKLVAKVTKPANIFAYTFGIICSLILGIGMCLAMEVIAFGNMAIISGIIIGVIGIIGCSTNYIFYKKIIEKGKNKYGSEIIKIAKEISEE